MFEKCVSLLLVILLFASTAIAIDLPQTGQTTCYDGSGAVIACADTGQDGELLMGTAWPSSRFTANAGTITDNLTGLMWLADGNCQASNYPGSDAFVNPGDGNVSWDQGLDFVAGMNSGTYSACNSGHTDWAAANVNELKSLINFEEADVQSWLQSQGFTNLSPVYYASTIAAAPSVWAVWMTDGTALPVNTGVDTPLGLPVMPVRYVGGGAVEIPKTGKTIADSLHPGDDSAQQRGTAWPSPRFNDNADGTVTDNLTGLVWLKDAGCFGTGDQSIVDLFNTNPASYPSCSTAFTDWRIPNVSELASLIDYSQFGPALPAGHPFINVPVTAVDYRTSTMMAATPQFNWSVMIGTGGQYSGSDYLWPVRGGFPAPDIAVTPMSRDFGTKEQGAASTNATKYIYNNGNLDLTLGTLFLSGTDSDGFSIQMSNCTSNTIVPDDNCFIVVSMLTDTIGVKSAIVNIPSNDPDTPIVSVPVSGEIVAPIPDTEPPYTSATPPGGLYNSEQFVTLGCVDNKSGCDVTYYTTDDSTPSVLSSVFYGPISISSDTTLKFFSIDMDGNMEGVQSESYNFPPAHCSDTIQNLDETGLDCGGADCAPCGGSWTIHAANYSLIDWPDAEHPPLTEGSYVLVDGVYYYVLYSGYESPESGTGYTFADLQQVDQQTGAPLDDFSDPQNPMPLWANFTGSEVGLPIEVFAVWGVSAGDCPTKIAGEMAHSPAMTDSGEIVWTEQESVTLVEQVFSSTRGQLTFGSNSIYSVDINNSGDIVWEENDGLSKIYILPFGTTIPVYVAEGSQPIIIDSGEVFYRDAGLGQVYSNQSGKMTTFDINNLMSFDVNNNRDLVWSSQYYDDVTYQTDYTINLLTNGSPNPTTIASSLTDFLDFPVINDSGEIVWIEMVPGSPRMVSSITGQITGFSCIGSVDAFELDIDNNGNLIYSLYSPSEPSENGVYLLSRSSWTVNSVEPGYPDTIDWLTSEHALVAEGEYLKIDGIYYQATLPAEGSWSGAEFSKVVLMAVDQSTGEAVGPADLSGLVGFEIKHFATWSSIPPVEDCGEMVSSGDAGTMNDLGEVVWAQYDEVSGNSQIYSSLRGQLTFSPESHSSPDINNYGTVVWSQYDTFTFVNTVWMQEGGNTLQVSSNGSNPAINDAGEIVYQNDTNEIISSVRGVLATGDNYYEADINNNGDVVWSRNGMVELLASGSGTPSFVGNGMSPSINDSGEVVWTEPTASGERIFSSTRGQLTSSCPAADHHMMPNINSCGDVVFSAVGPGGMAVYRLGDNAPCITPPVGGMCEQAGNATVVSSGDAGTMNDLGEVVWAQYDEVSGNSQIYSSLRGQLTFSPESHSSPDINNYGTVVWSQYDTFTFVNTVWMQEGGNTLQVSSNGSNPAINDAGEIVYQNDTNEIISSVRGVLATGDNYYEADINNNGDVVWSRNGMVELLASGSGTPSFVGNGMSPSINDSGEVVWTEPTASGERIFSSTRGQLTSSCPAADHHMMPNINSCGDVVFSAVGPGGMAVYRLGDNAPCITPPVGGMCEQAGNATVVSSGDAGTMNDLGEVVWAQYDEVSGNSQIYSSLRGQLTSSPESHSSPDINNYGTVVWSQYDTFTLVSTVWMQEGGNTLQVSSNGSNPAINDAGEIVYQNDTNEIISSVRGVLATGDNYYEADINNNGDVVWSRNGMVELLASGSGTPSFVANGMSPSINDSGEVVWSEPTPSGERIFSSTRGQLTSSCPAADHHMMPNINSCGDVVFSAVVPGGMAVYRLGDICDGDADNDGLPDLWELKNGLDPSDPNDALSDLDEDGISNLDEFTNGTNPSRSGVLPTNYNFPKNIAPLLNGAGGGPLDGQRPLSVPGNWPPPVGGGGDPGGGPGI